MSKDESPKGNEALTTAVNLVEDMFAGGDSAPVYFKEFVQHLLSKTIMDTQKSSVRSSQSGDISFVHGPKREAHEKQEAIKGRDLYHPLKLNDGKFLYLYFENFVDRSENNWLKTTTSKMSYQLDSGGHYQLFRFDYSRLVKTAYSASHVHIYGDWRKEVAEAIPKIKSMHKVHFPVVRPTLEGMIRILVDDFEVPTNTDRSIWLPMLEATERKFKAIMSKNIHRAEPSVEIAKK